MDKSSIDTRLDLNRSFLNKSSSFLYSNLGLAFEEEHKKILNQSLKENDELSENESKFKGKLNDSLPIAKSDNAKGEVKFYNNKTNKISRSRLVVNQIPILIKSESNQKIKLDFNQVENCILID